MSDVDTENSDDEYSNEKSEINQEQEQEITKDKIIIDEFLEHLNKNTFLFYMNNDNSDYYDYRKQLYVKYKKEPFFFKKIKELFIKYNIIKSIKELDPYPTEYDDKMLEAGIIRIEVIIKFSNSISKLFRVFYPNLISNRSSYSLPKKSSGFIGRIKNILGTRKRGGKKYFKQTKTRTKSKKRKTNKRNYGFKNRKKIKTTQNKIIR